MGSILEAQPLGAQIDNISKYDALPMSFSPDRIEPPCLECFAPLLLHAESYSGIGYGFLDIALLAVKLQFHHTPEPLTHFVLDSRRMICSQLVAQFALDYGVDWCCGQSHAAYVTPGLLAERGVA